MAIGLNAGFYLLGVEHAGQSNQLWTGLGEGQVSLNLRVQEDNS